MTITDLSDDELVARLVNRGMGADTARITVPFRDDDEVAAWLVHVIEHGIDAPYEVAP